MRSITPTSIESDQPVSLDNDSRLIGTHTIEIKTPLEFTKSVILKFMWCDQSNRRILFGAVHIFSHIQLYFVLDILWPLPWWGHGFCWRNGRSRCCAETDVMLKQMLCGAHIDGILPKGPFPPYLRMADRAHLAWYHGYAYAPYCGMIKDAFSGAVGYTH